ncbi:hypothetical protein PG984_005407 [Apiospora sp. TS-2023a]
MARSSTQSVYGGATPSKSPNVITASTESPPKTEISSNNVELYMAIKNEGGDPVTALALRSDTPLQSVAERLARVHREMAASLERIGNP